MEFNVTTYTYILKYSANDGKGAPGDQKRINTRSTVLYEEFKCSSTTPTRDNYDFLGWADTSTATSAQYSGGDTVQVYRLSSKTSATKTIYAVWKRVYSYSLSYNANGGTGAPSEQTATSYKTSYTFTISSSTPTRTGYAFKGWSTSSSGSASYQPGDEFKCSSSSPSRTLYAVWEEIVNSYAITIRSDIGFSGGGYIVNSSGKKVTSTTLYGYKCSRSGNTITATKVDDSTTSATAGANSGYRIYGWNPDGANDTYSVIFYKQEHTYSFSVDTGEWTSGGNLTTDEGKTKAKTASASGTTISSSSASYVVTDENTSESTTITPVPDTNWVYDAWSKTGDYSYVVKFTKKYSTYTIGTEDLSKGYVKIDGDKIETRTKAITLEVDSKHSLEGVSADSRAWHFSHWTDGKTDNPYKIYVGLKDTSYTAYWAKEHYQVKFDGNGGKPTRDSVSDEWGTKFSDLGITATRAGYDFDGWYSAASGGREVTEIEIPSTGYSSTVYAHWVKTQVLTVDVYKDSSSSWICGGIVAIDGETSEIPGGSYSKEIRVGVYHKIEARANLVERYSYFDSWSDGKDRIHNVAITKDTTITATFKRYRSKITFYDGDEQYILSRYNYAGLKPLDAPWRSKTGQFVFDGYYDKNGTKYYNADLSPVSSIWTDISEKDIDVYAKWVPYYIMEIDQGGQYSRKYIYEKYQYGWFSDKECTKQITNVGTPPGIDKEHYRFVSFQMEWPVSSGTKIDVTDSSGNIIVEPIYAASRYWGIKQQEIVWITVDVQSSERGYITPSRYQGKHYYDIDSSTGQGIEDINATAVGNAGWEFTQWNKNGEKYSESKSLFVNVSRGENGNVYKAYFKIIKYALKTEYYDEHSKITPYRKKDGSYPMYQYGSTVILRALPDPSSTYGPDYFVKRRGSAYGWEKIPDTEGDDYYPVTIDETTTRYEYAVKCIKKWSIVAVKADPDIPSLVTGGTSKGVIGQKCKIQAKSNDLYSFEGWYNPAGERMEGWTAIQEVVIPEEPIVYTAKFKVKMSVTKIPTSATMFVVEKTSRDQGDSNHFYTIGNRFSYTAKDKNVGSDAFKQWTMDGIKVPSTYDPLIGHVCEVLVDGAHTMCAEFENGLAVFTITVTSTNPSVTTVGGGGKYAYWDKPYIWCQVNDDEHSFEEWLPDHNKLWKRQITVTGDATYIAKINGDDFVPRTDDSGIDESPWYRPSVDEEGCGVPLGYNDYADWDLNPITNYYYRKIHPEAEAIYSNCTWYACGRTMEISNTPYPGATLTQAGTWFDCAYKNVNGVEWKREGNSDFNSYKGQEMSYFEVGDILCWYCNHEGEDSGHIDIVEGVDNENQRLTISYGRYASMCDGTTSRCGSNTISFPKVGDTGGGAGWDNVYFQGVIHNPNRSGGGRYPVVRMVPVPEGAGKAYVDGQESKGVELGTEVTLTYEENEGHTFTKWWDGTKTQGKRYIVSSTADLYAYFDNFDPKTQVYVTAKINPEGIGTIEGGGIHQKGETVILSYKLDEEALNYNFLGWSDGTQEDDYIIENIQDNVYITANFSNAGGGGGQPEGDLIPLFGDGNEIDLKELEFDISVYTWNVGISTGAIRPALNIYINGTLYQTIPEGEIGTYTLTFDPTVKTSDIQIKTAKDYTDSKNSLVINSMKISYYGWDENRGEELFTRYFNGTKWTEWVKEE